MKRIKPGRKTKKWNNARRKCNQAHFENQRTYCENCGSTFALSNAHRFKRNFINSEEELSKTVVLCAKCHDYADNVLNREQMKEFLDKLLETRADRYWSAA